MSQFFETNLRFNVLKFWSKMSAMNSESEKDNLSPYENTEASNASMDAPISKKSRWWVYVLIGLGSLLLLGIIAILTIYSYYRSLINNYTETKPRAFPQIVVNTNHLQDFIMRWTNYVAEVLDKHSTQQFIITEEDINQGILNISKGKDFARVTLTNGYIRALLSIPLSNSGKKELQGRYLNADADLKLQIEDGILTLRVESAIANGKPVPRWIIKKLRQKNLLENLENNFEFLELLQAMESVQVKDGAIVFTPEKNEK